jgi:hypothetical protein
MQMLTRQERIGLRDERHCPREPSAIESTCGAEVRVLDSASGKDVALPLKNSSRSGSPCAGRDRVYVVTLGDDYRTQGSFGPGEFQTQVTSYEVETWRKLARRSGYLPQRISAW